MMRTLLCGVLFALVATVSNAKTPPPPPDAPVLISPAPAPGPAPIAVSAGPSAFDYGVIHGMMARCADRAPMLAKQLPAATAAWDAQYSAARIEALRAGAEADAVAEGRARAAQMDAETEDVMVGGQAVPVMPFACASMISDFAPAEAPKLSGSRVERRFSDTAYEIAVPFVLAKLDCARFDAIEVHHPERPARAIGDIAETWTFRACGRSLDLSFRRVDDAGAVHMRDDIAALYRSLLP
jgi:hypothetical protein